MRNIFPDVNPKDKLYEVIFNTKKKILRRNKGKSYILKKADRLDYAEQVRKTIVKYEKQK